MAGSAQSAVVRSFGLIAAVVALAACGSGTQPEGDAGAGDAGLPDAAQSHHEDAGAPGICASETRDDDYSAGMSLTGPAGYAVTLLSMSPPPPTKGRSNWELRVSDPSGDPIDGLMVTAYPFMPDHGHGTSSVTVTPMGSGGRYDLGGVNLFMTGYWTIRIRLFDSGGTELDAVTYRFCVEGT